MPYRIDNIDNICNHGVTGPQEVNDIGRIERWEAE